MNINKWLQNFKSNWENHNINGILSLFDKNIVYYETPFHKVNDFDSLKREWKTIHGQKEIVLEYDIFSSTESRHSVIWNLKYINTENKEVRLRGTYLIELSTNNLCTFFHHTFQSE